MTKVRPNWLLIYSFVSIFAISNSALSMNTITIPKGEQKSELGIKHSFLVTGPKTCIVNEESEIIWQINRRSRAVSYTHLTLPTIA